MLQEITVDRTEDNRGPQEITTNITDCEGVENNKSRDLRDIEMFVPLDTVFTGRPTNTLYQNIL